MVENGSQSETAIVVASHDADKDGARTLVGQASSLARNKPGPYATVV
jgi:hypothetical protein